MPLTAFFVFFLLQPLIAMRLHPDLHASTRPTTNKRIKAPRSAAMMFPPVDCV